jgi:glucose-6-phosphate isomerase
MATDLPLDAETSGPVRDDLTDLDRLAEQHLDKLDQAKAIVRIWQRDGALFSEDPAVARAVRNRLGWLFSVQTMRDQVERLAVLARVVERQGYDRVLVVGMGGSSLWPEVVGRHLRGKRGMPIRVCDSTHPEAIADWIGWCREGKALFVVATKSGGTLETLSAYKALRHAFDDGNHFVAITDAGSGLESLARAHGFREVFLNPVDIGGRFSATSLFGLVPAALAGVVLQDALDRVDAMLTECREEDPRLNPGARLGAFLAAAQQTGRWQMRLALGKDVKGFGNWIEQLVGESTGKLGTGVLPVLGGVEGAGAQLEQRLAHAVVVGLTTFAKPDEEFLLRATAAGIPQSAEVMPEVADLWTEVVRWEFATTVAGWLLGINPFDEPDVTSAKTATAAILAGQLAPVEPTRRLRVASLNELPGALSQELASLPADDYVAVLAWLAPTQGNLQRLEALRQTLQTRTDAAVVVQVGPRYLHSTGQFHKGGLPRGLFVVVTDSGRTDVADIAIPQADFGFARLVQAQAQGDVAVLMQRGKPVVVAELVPPAQS